jgi:hypothetical protein
MFCSKIYAFPRYSLHVLSGPDLDINLFFIQIRLGHAIAQVVGRRLSIAETPGWPQKMSFGVCDEQSGNAVGFLSRANQHSTNYFHIH